MIRALVLDQPGAKSEEILERRIDRLAWLLRRSPAAVRRAFYAQRALVKQRDVVLEKVLRLKEPLELLGGLLKQEPSDD